MSIPSSLTPLFSTGAGGAAGYQISRSLRFNSADSAYLSRTPGTAGDRKKWTWSGWVKRGALDGNRQVLFGTGDSGLYNSFEVEFFGDILRISDTGESGGTIDLRTTQVFRDCSAWGHLLVSLDTAQTTASDRANIYWNGVKITTFSTATYPGLSTTCLFNTTAAHGIGRAGVYNAQYLNGYLADIHFIDGQALTPSSFTEVSDTTGQLVPIAYTGSYGTNGFHLPFSDNSTAAALGTDTSGNSNNWTPNNFSVAGGPNTITTPASNAPPTVDCLVIAGGGGGSGGGGGAGGYLEQTGRTVNAGTSYSITIGEGSSGGLAQSDRPNGGNSVFDTIIALGGGGGGKDNSTGRSGGSGSGGGATNTGNYSGGAATQGNSGGATGYGFAGGTAPSSSGPYPAAGGGGAGAVGGSPSANVATSGDGGAGRASSITGTSVIRGGGGGGGNSSTSTPGAGGSGGGGGGATAGNANTGGGGGGGTSSVSGGAGGSGIVIIRYADTYADLTVGGGLTYTYVNTGGYKIYSFTASATAAQSAGNDILVDTPTSYGTPDTGVGGEVRGNYCTLNPLDKGGGASAVNGNLDLSFSSAGSIRSTIGLSSGKWYWEATVGDISLTVGIAKGGTALSAYLGSQVNEWSYGQNASKITGGSSSAYGATFTTGDVIGIAFDADNGTLTFYKNGSSQGTAFTGLTSGPYFPAIGDNSATSGHASNFGQRPFAYTAPSGFKALCTTNLPAPLVAKPNELMDVALWTGNGGNQSITLPGSFNPDLVWVKSRSNGQDHYLFDAVRGGASILRSNTTGAESTGTTYLSFDTSGFSSLNGLSSNGYTYVGWAWDAGTSTDPSNTAGSITSQVRANVSAGFSVVTYTGNGNNSATVGHGLNLAPSMIIVKDRSAANHWAVVHTSCSITGSTTIVNPEYKMLRLDGTDAEFAYQNLVVSPGQSSTTFTLGNQVNVNGLNNNYVAYCFAPVVGYSAALAWTGNGSNDGTMIYCGFSPRFWIFKRTDTTGDWWMIDTARSNTGNPVDEWLAANRSDAEYPNDGDFDFLSNGIKIRTTSTSVNASGGSYIGFAFAENPFQYSRAR
jgi:hypothetical protein